MFDARKSLGGVAPPPLMLRACVAYFKKNKHQDTTYCKDNLTSSETH